MSTNNIFIFPAFVLRYMGNEQDLIKQAGVDFSEKLSVISRHTQTDLSSFDVKHNNFIEKEEENQLVSYLISCIYCDILLSRGFRPFRMGYLSMGLYASLYCGQSITLEEGATLIKRVFKIIKEITEGSQYGMLNVVGLSRKDVNDIIDKEKLKCEAVIQNSSYSFILSGEEESLKQFQEKATEEGALHLNRFPVIHPYHSSYLKRITDHRDEILSDINIKDLKYPLFSCHEGRDIVKNEEICREIINNLINPVNWEHCMVTLNSLPGCRFYECGPGNSISKMSRFMNGNFDIACLSTIFRGFL